jgi:hypothetical protein
MLIAYVYCISNLLHLIQQDLSLSGYIFTRLRLVKIWSPAREISRHITP